MNYIVEILIAWIVLYPVSKAFNIYPTLWLTSLPISILITIFCWITNPIACLFVTYENGRANLWGWAYLWQTYDNNVDEYYFGNYGTDKPTLHVYNYSAWLRYKYRVLWLTRNTGYGFSYKFLSIPKGEGFQFKGHTKPLFGYYNDYNCGWKAHKGFDRLDYAARIIGLRKVK